MSRWDGLKPHDNNNNKSEQHSSRLKNGTKENRYIPPSSRNNNNRRQSPVRWRSRPIEEGNPSRIAPTPLQSLQAELQAVHTNDLDVATFRQSLKTRLLPTQQQCTRISAEFLSFLIDVLDVDDEETTDLVVTTLHRVLLAEPVWDAVVSSKDLAKTVYQLGKYHHRFQWSSTAFSPTVQYTICMSRLVSRAIPSLKPERTAVEIIGPVFVPCLQQVIHASSTHQVIPEVCRTFSTLFQHPTFASAVFAPLVENIRHDGAEVCSPNPLRHSILDALQSHLTNPHHEKSTECEVANCLATALNALCRIDQHGSRNGILVGTKEIDFSVVEEWISTTLESTHINERLTCTIHLLLASLQYKPQECIRLGSRILFYNSSSTPSNPPALSHSTSSSESTSLHGSSLLVRICLGYHEADVSKATLIDCFSCLAALVTTLPWKKWLWSKSSNDRRRIARQPVSGFHRKVIGGFTKMLAVAECAFALHDSTLAESVSQLAAALFSHVPDALKAQASTLWSTMFESLLNAQIPTDFRQSTANVVVACMGGKVTPDGTLEGMCSAARASLEEDSSRDRLSEVLLSLESCDSHATIARDLLAGILRTFPTCIAPLLNRFLRYCVGQSESFNDVDRKVRLDRLAIFAAFMLGRRDFLCDTSDENLVILPAKAARQIVEQLQEGKEENQAWLSCLKIVGSLLSADWQVMKSSSDLFRTVVALLSSSNSGVRAEVCRAIAQMCQTYLSSPGTFDDGVEAQVVVHLVIQSMKEAANDKKDSVRAMAMFALGNLSQSLNGLDRPLDIEPIQYQEINGTLLEGCEDGNSKVISNVIRALGHSFQLLNAKECHQDGQLVELQGQILRALTKKVSCTISSVVDGTRSQLTWKERSAAKKQGWGACFSLGSVLGSWTEMPRATALQDGSRHAFHELVALLSPSAALNEKVTLAAIGALRSTAPSVAASLSGDSGDNGNVLAFCLPKLDRRINPANGQQRKIKLETELLLLHVLQVIVVKDGLVLLEKEDTTKRTMECLYHSMIQEKCGSRTFDVIASALHQASFDVDLEHRFASRALQLSKSNDCEAGGQDESDDEL